MNTEFKIILLKIFQIKIILLLSFLLIAVYWPTKYLMEFNESFEYSRLYYSVVLPAELLSLLLSILIFIADLNFKNIINKIAISLILFNSYSFTVLHNFFPLFILNDFYLNLSYQIFLTLSNYITLIYGIVYVKNIRITDKKVPL